MTTLVTLLLMCITYPCTIDIKRKTFSNKEKTASFKLLQYSTQAFLPRGFEFFLGHSNTENVMVALTFQ